MNTYIMTFWVQMRRYVIREKRVKTMTKDTRTCLDRRQIITELIRAFAIRLQNHWRLYIIYRCIENVPVRLYGFTD